MSQAIKHFILSKVLVPAFYFAAFTIIDPFGLASVTSTASRELSYRALSLFQPDDAGRHIAVVLVDDRSARVINGDAGYPISFVQHANALRPVLCSGPSALFVDITFRGLRGDPANSNSDDPKAAIAPLIDRLATKPSPDDPYCQLPDPERFHPSSAPFVFMGRTHSNPPDPCDPLFPQSPPGECQTGQVLDALRTVTIPLTVAAVPDDTSYLLSYPADGNLGGTQGSGERLQPSPALAMVLAFCKSATARERQELPGCRDRDELIRLLDPTSPQALREMHLLWSYYKTDAYLAESARHGGAGSSGCHAEQLNSAAGFFGRASVISFEFWHTLFRFGRENNGVDEGAGQNSVFGFGHCLPADTFNLLDVRQMSSHCQSGDTGCEERLANFFAGRMVFYGIDVTGINDNVPTPVLGRVPGTAYHAAAAENLLNHGASYRRSSSNIVSMGEFRVTTSQAVDIVLFAIAALLVGVFRCCPHLIDRRKDPPSWCLARSKVLFALCPGILLLIGAISVYLAGQAGLPAWPLCAATVTVALFMTALVYFVISPGTSRRSVHRFLFSVGRAQCVLGLATAVVVFLALAATTLLLLPPANALASIVLLMQLPSEK